MNTTKRYYESLFGSVHADFVGVLIIIFQGLVTRLFWGRR